MNLYAILTEMARSLRGHIRGNVVGYIALFFALSTGAYAAGLAPNSVKSRHVKNNTLKSVDVRNNSLKSVDLKDGRGVAGADVVDGTLGASDLGTGSVGGDEIQGGSVTGSHVADGTLTSQDLGYASVGPRELGRITGHESATITVPPGESRAGTALCDDGEEVLSGGMRWLESNDTFFNLSMMESRRSFSQNGWFARGENPAGNPHDMVVYAYCLASY